MSAAMPQAMADGSIRIVGLRADQCDLIAEGLLYWSNTIENSGASEAHKAAGRFTRRRIDEVLALLDHAPSTT